MTGCEFHFYKVTKELKSEVMNHDNVKQIRDDWKASPLNERFELKYIISLNSLKVMLEQLKPYLTIDPNHINSKPYRVESIYFDSRNYKLYHENIDGIKNRRKLRIRFYPNKESEIPQMSYVEIKRKFGKVIGKSRVKMESSIAQDIIEQGRQGNLIAKNPQDDKTLSEIWYLIRAFKMKPMVRIGYDRLAFYSEKDPTVRVTFDRNVTASLPHWDHPNSEIVLPVLNSRLVILEVKYRWSKPQWLRRIVANRNCKVQRMSKYVTSIQALKLTRNNQSLRRGYLHAMAIKSWES